MHWGAVVVMLIVGFCGSVLINATVLTLALQPLHALERTVDRVAAGDLSARAQPVLFRDPDVERLGDTLNTMLDVLQRAPRPAAEDVRAGARSPGGRAQAHCARAARRDRPGAHHAADSPEDPREGTHRDRDARADRRAARAHRANARGRAQAGGRAAPGHARRPGAGRGARGLYRGLRSPHPDATSSSAPRGSTIVEAACRRSSSWSSTASSRRR